MSIKIDRLTAQAEEARDLGLVKLADCIQEVIKDSNEDSVEFQFSDVSASVEKLLWKSAAQVINYHNVNDADVTKVKRVIDHLVPIVIRELESSIDKQAKVGPLEPKIIGQE
jgi:hypothetical protein